METTTSFNLNRAIQDWRESLAQATAFRTENLDELESHLGDSKVRLQSRGLSAEEAFLLATAQIGKRGALEKEFAKINAPSVWLDRMLWMLIGVQAWSLVNGIAGFTTQNLLLFGWKTSTPDQGMTFSIALVSTVRLLLLGATGGFCWWLIMRKGGGFSRWLGRKLQSRSSFLGCCVATSLLLVAGQILFFAFQALCIWRLGPETFGQRTLYLGHSQVITHFLQAVIMVLLILGLARKRLVSARA